MLEERGVPSEVLLTIIRASIDPQIAELKEMIHDPAKLVLWRHKIYPHEYQSFDGPGLPREPSRKAVLLVDRTGFMPSNNYTVAKAFERMIEGYLQRIRLQLRFPCLKSTMLFGLADTKGVLKPGEIHLVLSQPLEDEVTKERFHTFAEKDVLVARDPTIRGSDIQKVHCIDHPDLRHLKDVVIFPSTGQIPLAAKLQGGDYDGDKFWVCADERLVAPFKNAPVLEQRGIDFFGIEQEKRTLGEIVKPEDFGTDEHAKAFLRIVLPIACLEKPVGFVTNYCNDLSYARHRGKWLWDDDVTMIADLHDLVVDAAKNVYLFDKTKFEKFLKLHKLPSKLKERKYDNNIKAAELRHDDERGKKDGERDKKKKVSLRTILAENLKQKFSHILDRVLFEEINPRFHTYLDGLQIDVIIPAGDLHREPDLEFCLNQIEFNAQLKQFVDSDAEKRALEQPLRELLELWQLVGRNQRKESDELMLQCVEHYNNIKPANPNNLYWSMPAPTSSVPSN